MEDETLIWFLENTNFIAHRGDSWKYPENSYGAIMSSFENKDADGLEFDVKMTKDKKLVVRHDENMMLTSNSFKSVYNLTLEELKKMNVTAHKFDYYKHLLQVLKERKEEHGEIQLETLNQLYGKKDKIITLEELLQKAPLDKKLLLEAKGSDTFYKSDIYSRSIAEMVNEYSNKNIYVHGADSKTMINISKNTSKPVGIGIGADITNICLPLYHICLDINHLPKQLDKITEELIKRPEREIYFWKVETKRELELYKLFLNTLSEYDLNIQHGVMSNDVTSAKILFKKQINDLKAKRK